MSKVIVFQGSPVKRGKTADLVQEVIRGAKESGATVVEYDLNDPTMRPCQGCNACRRPEASACVQHDYLLPMYVDLKDAVGIVLATPIYMGTVTAQAWALINRLYPAMAPDHSPRFPGKKFVTVSCQGNPNPAEYRPALNDVSNFFKRLGWEPIGEILWANSNATPEASDELKAAAFSAGQKLAQ